MSNIKRFIMDGDYYYFKQMPKHLSGVSLDKSKISLTTIWQTEQLTATTIPVNPVETVSLNRSSSDTSIATVDNIWLVTCVNPWKCTITVTTTPWSYTASCGVTKARLPNEYQEVEYIQSTWSQYITTGLTLNNAITFDFKFQLTETTNEQGIIGARWGSNPYRHSLMIYNWMFHFMLWDGSAWNGSVDTNIHIVTMSWGNGNWTINVDGTDYTATSSITSSTSYPYYIFRNGSQNTSYVKMFYVKFYNSWTLVREFIPCYRIADTVIWMYDLENNVFYTNSWSWTFTKWPDV